MSINWHVSREEFDSSLRNSVNEYYEHAMNDPTMSHEEALQTSAEMAENYENAMAEYDAAAAEEAGNENGEVSDGGESSDGGDDAGEDGGME